MPLCHPLGPGSVYLGNLTAAFHQVAHHGDDMQEDLFQRADGEYCKVVLLFRTGAFADFRARKASSRPGPTEVYEAVDRAMARALTSVSLELPTLSECLAAAASLLCISFGSG